MTYANTEGAEKSRKTLAPVININEENCVNCHVCVAVCPVKFCNIDSEGVIHVDQDTCIGCGACILACNHDARSTVDDFSQFMAALDSGKKVVVIAAPSIIANFPGSYRRIFGWLRSLGVAAVFDVAFGAELSVKAYTEFMRKHDPPVLITQPCPAVVTFLEVHHPELLKWLAPLGSPMQCMMQAIRNFYPDYAEAEIAALSPCVAKRREFDEIGLGDYVVTFSSIDKYIRENNVDLLQFPESDYDGAPAERGVMFPNPGGLLKTASRDVDGVIEHTRVIEGVNTVFDYLLKLPGMIMTGHNPKLIDCLSCEFGCNAGPASLAGEKSPDELEWYTKKQAEELKKHYAAETPEETSRAVQKTLSEFWRTDLYTRQYTDLSGNITWVIPTEEEIQKVFHEQLKKESKEDEIDCRSCGFMSCRDMAIAIYNGMMGVDHCYLRQQKEIIERESLIAEKESLVSGILSVAQDGYIAFSNRKNTVTHFNDRFIEMWGFQDREKDMLGMHTQELHGLTTGHMKDATSFRNALFKLISTLEPGDGVSELKDGRIFSWHGRAATLSNGDVMRVWRYRDVTELELHHKHLEEQVAARTAELSVAMQAAESANKAKSSFLANMSHEIRTPMNAILGITEIQLQNESLDASYKEALNKVYSSGDMLLGIINDILDFSKIEAGKLELVITQYDTASLIVDTAQLNMMRIGSKPIEFDLFVDENLPAFLSGDPLRIKQILNNLLSNAFKYTAAGKVTLKVSAEAGDGADNMTLVLSVSDTGQGMSKEQVDKLFDEYSRFNLESNRSTEGTGLGMTITRSLISLMDGSISIDSEPGEGTTFTVHLPQVKVGSEVLGSERAENLHHFRVSGKARIKGSQIVREYMPYGSVLIVDDVETNIYVARGLLTPYGLTIDSAESGFEAIKMVENGSRYDVIFMDHMMPEMDGIETTAKLREKGYDRPIVALTANAVSGQSDIFLSSGFDDFISKPIDIRQLNAVLNKMIRDKQSTEVLEEAKKQAAEKKHDSADDHHGSDDHHADVDIHFAEIFVRDATKSLATLEEIIEKDGFDDEDIRTYVIHVHGMKSALANIGNHELSDVAKRLEQTGRDEDIETMATETPAFLNALRSYVDELAPEEEEYCDAESEDKELLMEKLGVIKEACEEYDDSTADEALAELMNHTWSKPTKDTLKSISEHLLHSDFDEIVSEIDSI